MNAYSVALGVHVSGELDDLEEYLDAVLDEFDGLNGVTDVDYVATLITGEVEFTGYVSASNPTEAHVLFLAAVRTAVHAAGGSTPGWPTFDETTVRIEPAAA